MSIRDPLVRRRENRRRGLRSPWSARLWCVAVVLAGLPLASAPPASAQGPQLQQGRLDPADCLKPGAPLYRIPELQSDGTKLRATIVLADQLRRLTDTGTGDCALVY